LLAENAANACAHNFAALIEIKAPTGNVANGAGVTYKF